MMYGSTIFVIALTESRIRDGRLWYAPWLFPGQHASMAGLATSGTLTHWFRDQIARVRRRETAFPSLVGEAETVAPGSDGLLFLPYFSGERTPLHDPFAKGAMFGLNLTHTRAHMFRALIEGIAYGTAHVVDTYREVGVEPTRVLAVGGGTRNALWLQTTSDTCGLGQIVREKTFGASFGNAFLAGVAVGQVGIDDIGDWNPAAREVIAREVPAYSRGYRLFRRLYGQTRDIAVDLG